VPNQCLQAFLHFRSVPGNAFGTLWKVRVLQLEN